MHRYALGAKVPFGTEFEISTGKLVDVTNPRVVLQDPIAGVTTVSLTKQATGMYAAVWTVPLDAALGFYDYYYAGTYDVGKGPQEFTGGFGTLEIVKQDPETSLGSVIGLSANALTTVGALKDELGIASSDTSLDTHLKRMINAASDWLEAQLHRSLRLETVTESLSGFGRQRLNLARYPISSLTSVKVDGADVTADCKILNGARGQRGQIWRKDGFPLSARGYGDLTSDTDPSTADLNVEVSYKGGYVLPQDESATLPRTLPWDIEWACLRIVKHWHDRDPGLKSEQSPTGYRYEVDPQLAQTILKDLAPYRRWA